MALPTIGFVIGSLRKSSFNRTLANEAAAILEGRAKVTFIEFSDLPFLNQDEEFPTPAPVARVREAVAACDALWVFTPEYNGTLPAQLKNFFDWMSRRATPEAPAQPTVLTEKPATASGASGGAATAGARAAVSDLMAYIYMNVMTEGQAGFVLPGQAWAEDSWTLSDDDRQALSAQADAFLAFMSK
ncbi:NADPH-dependent FMN reductase [Schaalia sp. Marseille-Q2122]|uniref:NADPH-dependent FMN reductase n=1 Tax=Schaalia sp. Marseille-Q2122 TaxID=2736604 RepID=UPI00158D5E8C|nr:NADPH-dependent FMN reductase [Schaalia sp. Marseille-Q2122]